MLQELCAVLEQHAFEQPCAGGSVTLVEENQNSKITISGVPSATVVIRLDGNASHMSIVQQIDDLHKICDYLLITNWHNEVRAVLIEIKENLRKSLWQKGVEQVCRSLPFLYYLHSVTEVECNGSCVSCEHVPRFYWVLAPRESKFIDKQRTRGGGPTPRTENCHGVAVRGLAGVRIPFDKLVPP